MIPRFASMMAICAGVVCFSSVPIVAQDLFKENIRTTQWLSPDDELASFVVPDGFKVQLFASEPEIAKPLNMAFDSRGRLWVTNTVEYPHSAPDDRPGRDSIKILEDSNGDGHADKVTTFADGLNIPIGILPGTSLGTSLGISPDEDACIAFSIPNIWKLEDTDGDGKCDRRTVLYGPFGVDRDTHGLNNAFRRGLDGWIYACHGYNNHSEVKGTDGNVVTMTSGNTYRFREDGSRIEHFTWGQVNPFGMAMDERGNFFTSDCHSKPLYQLLQGGYYPSFGKPHDGLGFVPSMMKHLHDSTAIDGVCYCDDDRLPKVYRRNFLVGNVMTGRVNRDRIDFHGSTMLAVEQDDLLSTSDPWFRPVDIQLGPDGAIYVADFYNKIIGHYEVDLEHPGRDRTSGRIWRLVWQGDEKNGLPVLKETSMEQRSDAELLSLLAAGNIARRMNAFHKLTSRVRSADSSRETTTLVRAMFEDSVDDRQRALCVWILEHGGALSGELISKAASTGGSLTRLYACQVLSERETLSGAERKLLYKLAVDRDPFVRRKAIQSLGLHPEAGELTRFCRTINDVTDDDPMLRHAARLALRNFLQDSDAYRHVDPKDPQSEFANMVADVSVAVKTPESAAFLMEWIRAKPLGGFNNANDSLKDSVRHVARFLPADRTEAWIASIRQRYQKHPGRQHDMLFSMQDGFKQRGDANNEQLNAWATDLASTLLSDTKSDNEQKVRRITMVTEIVGRFRLQELRGQLGDLLAGNALELKAKLQVAESLAATSGDSRLIALANLAAQEDVPLNVRDRIFALLAGDAAADSSTGDVKVDAAPVSQQFHECIAGLTTQMQLVVAEKLVADSRGAVMLVKLIADGKLSTELLRNDTLRGKLNSVDDGKLREQTQSMFDELPSVDGRVMERIASLHKAFDAGESDPVKGRLVFEKHCANCHQVGGVGSIVGPQLDGIRGRGTERLLEDIFLPNRNVDIAFRTTVINGLDGRVLNGLFRNEESGVLTFVDARGEAFSISRVDIEESYQTKLSLMPENWLELLSEQEIVNLLGFLSGTQQKPADK